MGTIAPKLAHQLDLKVDAELTDRIEMLSDLEDGYSSAISMMRDLIGNALRGKIDESSAMPAVSDLSKSSEFVERQEPVLIQHMISRLGPELHDIIIADESASAQRAAIRDLIHRENPFAIGTIKRKAENEQPMEEHTEATRIMQALYNKKFLTPQIDRLLRNGEVKLVRLGVKDLPEVQGLYDPFRLTRLEALSLLAGEKRITQQTFLFPFDRKGHEKDTMTQLLTQTDTLEKKGELEKDCKLETMFVYGLRNPAGRLLSACVITRGSPHDPAYMKKQKDFANKGFSGGTMLYTTTPEEMVFRKELASGKSVEVSLIIGIEPGAALATLNGTVQTLVEKNLIKESNTFRASILHALRLISDKKMLTPDATPIGGNPISTAFFQTKAGFSGHIGTDENSKKSAEHVWFRMGRKTLRIRPVWKTMSGDFKTVTTTLAKQAIPVPREDEA